MTQAKFSERPGARDALKRAIGQGFLAVGRLVLSRANVPDAPPLGTGLVQRGGAVAYVDGYRVEGSDADATFSATQAGGIPQDGVVVGFGFPGRFLEVGTSKMAARPFLGPAAGSVVSSGEAQRALVDAANRNLPR